MLPEDAFYEVSWLHVLLNQIKIVPEMANRFQKALKLSFIIQTNFYFGFTAIALHPVFGH